MTNNCELVGPYTYDPNVVVLWVPIIADAQAPTDVEIVTGGVDLQPNYNLTDIIGWEIETETLRDGIWGPFEEQRMGGQAIRDSRLMFAAGRDGSAKDVRSLWLRGEVGNIVIMPSGPYQMYPTAPINVYPVRVSQITQQQRLRTGGASLLMVTFVIRARCGENVFVVGT